jgi:hypothetical protein
MLTRPGWEVPKKVQMILEMNPDSAALGCAETAAFGGGGGFLVRVKPDCMQVQTKYREFMEKNGSLFEGLDSFAEVAVAVFPEQKYFGNAQHIVEVRKATQHLLDGHVLFDYMIGDQFTHENLKKFGAIVLPRVQYMSDERAAALKRYVEEGGFAVVIGSSPEFDEKGRKKEPHALDAILDKRTDGSEIAIKRVGAGATAFAASLPPHGTVLAEWFHKISGNKLSIIESPQTPVLAKVRVNAFVEPAFGSEAQARRGANHYIIHLVNYNVPLGVEARAPETLGPIAVALRLPAPADGMKLTCYDPLGETIALTAKSEGKTLRFTLPQLRIHKIVEIK